MPLLLDTGVLFALADADDAWHARAVALVDETRDVLMTTAPVIPEVTYLLRARLGADVEQRFVASLAAGELLVEPLSTKDLARAASLMRQRPDIGFVDASVVAVAERLKLDRIATTDRRHFESIVPSHRRSFTLVP